MKTSFPVSFFSLSLTLQHKKKTAGRRGNKQGARKRKRKGEGEKKGLGDYSETRVVARPIGKGDFKR